MEYINQENFNTVLTRKSNKNISWKEIDERIQDGCINDILSVGDTISFSLKDGRKVRVAVAAESACYKSRRIGKQSHGKISKGRNSAVTTG